MAVASPLVSWASNACRWSYKTFLLASASIPELDGLVKGGAGQQARVWREEHLVDEGLVACEACHGLLLLRRVPHEEREVVRARHQPLRALALWGGRTQESFGMGDWGGKLRRTFVISS